MRLTSWNVCALISISFASCGTAEPSAPPSTVLVVADVSAKSKALAKVAVLSPAANFEAAAREVINVKGAVTVAEGEKGPQSLRIRISKAKVENADFGTFSLVPEQRENSYEFEAKLAAPNVPGAYELRCIGTYQLQGPDGEVVNTSVESDAIKFKVQK